MVVLLLQPADHEHLPHVRPELVGQHPLDLYVSDVAPLTTSRSESDSSATPTGNCGITAISASVRVRR